MGQYFVPVFFLAICIVSTSASLRVVRSPGGTGWQSNSFRSFPSAELSRSSTGYGRSSSGWDDSGEQNYQGYSGASDWSRNTDYSSNGYARNADTGSSRGNQYGRKQSDNFRSANGWGNAGLRSSNSWQSTSW